MRWQGFIGAPGYSIFHFRDFGAPEGWDPTVAQAQECVDKVRTFADAIKGNIVYGSSLQVLNDVEEIEDTTGEMVNVMSTTAPAVVNATTTAAFNYAGPVGAVINWRTSTVRRGRRIQGRTFLVPLLSNNFEVNGTLGAGSITTLAAAAAALSADGASPDLGVYARPSKDGVTPGQWAPVTGYNVPDMGAVLRSRRD